MLTKAGSMPVSSMVSRSAVSTGERSPASRRPPGKLTWPRWRARCSVRRVKSRVGSLARSDHRDQHRGCDGRGLAGGAHFRIEREIIMANIRRRLGQQHGAQRRQRIVFSRQMSVMPPSNAKNIPPLHTPSPFVVRAPPDRSS